MALNLASPGIVVREVDLTVGRVNPTSDKTGGLVAPFAIGPVDLPILVESEQDLLTNFGEPYPIDKHYEHWLTASSYLAYGGSLRIVRSDDDDLKNAFVGSASSIKIKSVEHYNQLGYEENTITGVTFAAKNPGSWANGLRVAIIDSRADQILTGINTLAVTSFNPVISDRIGTIVGSGNTVAISTSSVSIGQVVRCDVSGVLSDNTIVSGVSTGVITLSNSSSQSGNITTTFDLGSITTTLDSAKIGYGVTQAISANLPGIGTFGALNGYLKGIITEVNAASISVKVVSHVSAAGSVTNVDYQPLGVYAFSNSGSVAIHTSATASGVTTTYTSTSDWFDQQSLGVTTTSTIMWNNIAQRPSTSTFATARGSRFDEVHVVVIDSTGQITGNAGTILEKHLSLSKGSDAEFSLGSPSYWRKYLSTASNYVFGGSAPAGIVTTSTLTNTFGSSTDIGWDQEVDGIAFGAIGSQTYSLSGGVNYNGSAGITTSGALSAPLSKLANGYDLFANVDNYKVDFLIMGSANYTQETAQSLANKLIAVAEERKDAIAFISPYRRAFLTDTATGSVTVNSDSTITDNIIGFYSPITSSSYAVFDSGYKYMYDRFSDTFRYVPTNGDVAGLCARTDNNSFPWFSPAGTSRGAILNAVKLAYNPSKTQRDRLYSNRINPIVFSPGSGIILFGDRTGLGKASAFDRINVRRLFIYLENAIAAAAKDQLFEFNDEITRSNFVNIVEPFLRDVQSKRGIFDYVVVCDETNNTAAVIDNNEFVADIYIKPARSINFIGLTFVATRTGVSFEEIIGNV